MRKFGLIGYPLGHSFSKKFFTEKFEKEEITGVQYELYPITSVEALPDLIHSEDLSGLNVTIPYKQKVMHFLNAVDEDAQAIGAVNCIDIRKEKEQYFLKGYNTDAFGFKKSFVPNLKANHTKALILGTGGAAKAIEHVLKGLNIQVVYVSRNPKGEQIAYGALDEAKLNAFHIIINCTPIGTYPNVSQAPNIPYELLSEKHYLYDLVYNPSETEFMRLGAQKSAFVKNGFDMLVGQAERSWEIWNQKN